MPKTIDMTNDEAFRIARAAVGLVIARNRARNADRDRFGRSEEYEAARDALYAADNAMVEAVRLAFPTV